jgi:Co/Zn/Cd efflux system component
LIAPNSNPDQLLKDIQDILSKKYNINHLTLQIEKEDIQLNCKEC